MVSIKKMARVTRRSSSKAVPSVLDGDLTSNAELVWTAVRRQIEANATMTPLDGQPGYYWRGSVNGIINELWPTLSDGYLISADDAEEVKLALNRYLRNSRNLVCRQRGMRSMPSVWWVSDKWSPVITTLASVLDVKEGESTIVKPSTGSSSSVFDVSQPVPAVLDVSIPNLNEEAEEAEAEAEVEAESDTTYKCRYEECDHKPFTLVRIRNRHEYQMHGLAIQRDGTRMTFDPKVRITDQEVEDAITLVLDDHGGDEMSLAMIVKEAKRLDPRVSKINANAVIHAMLAAGKVEHGSSHTGYYQYYSLVGTKATVDEAAAVDEDPKVVEATELDGFEEAVIQIVHEAVGQTSTSRHEDIQQRLADLHTGLHELGTIIGSGADVDALTGERDQLRTKVEELKARIEELEAELETVTTDRDQLQAQLDTIKSMFN